MPYERTGVPSPEDFVLEHLDIQLTLDRATALNSWRVYIGEALEAWDLVLATRLVAELARHRLDTLGQAHLRMGQGALLFKRDYRLDGLARLVTAEQLFAQTNDAIGHCWALMTLGSAYDELGMPDRAKETYQRALAIYQVREDAYGEAQVLVNLGVIYRTQCRWGEALDVYQRSLDIFLEVGDTPSSAMSLDGLGHILEALGVYEQAIECYETSLAIFEEDGNVHAQVAILNGLACALDSVDQHERAIACFRQSIALAQQLSDLYSQATALINLGIVLQNTDRRDEAQQVYEQGLAVYEMLEDRQGISVCLNQLGSINRAAGRLQAAEGYFARAVALKREIDDQAGLASVLINWGLLCVQQERWDRVEALAQEAADLALRTASDERAARAQMLLGLADTFGRGDIDSAAGHFAQAVRLAWRHHPLTGQRINRAMLRHLEDWVNGGRADWARRVCTQVLQIVGSEIGDAAGESLADWVAFPEQVTERDLC